MGIARALNRTIVGARRLVGRDSRVRASRHGIEWDLDINEGIDLAVYLNLYQTIPALVLERYIRPASVVIDIGANVGAMSLPMAQACEAGRVVAVEPTDYAYSKLVRNVALNPSLQTRVVPVQAALVAKGSGKPASATFYSRWPLDGEASHRHTEHQGELEEASGARFVALDDLIAELRGAARISGPISFVKLDVDGHELSVLRGAPEMLAKERPPMIVEITPHVQDEVPGRFEELLEIFKSHGYMLENPVTGARLPSDAAGLRKHIPHGASLDAFASVEGLRR
jgi:FkbM family methyltransferase